MAILAFLGAVGLAIGKVAVVGGAAVAKGAAVAAPAVAKGTALAAKTVGQGAQMGAQGLWQGVQAAGRGGESVGSSLWNSTAGRAGSYLNPTSSYSGNPAVRDVATSQMRSSAHEGIRGQIQDRVLSGVQEGFEGYGDSQGSPGGGSPAVGVGGQSTPAEPFQAAEYPPISTAYASQAPPAFDRRDAIRRYTGGML